MTTNITEEVSEMTLTQKKRFLDERFVFYISAERWMYKQNDEWQTRKMLKDKALTPYLLEAGLSEEEAKAYIKRHLARPIYGMEIEPNAGPFFRRDGLEFINLWIPPRIKPAQGKYENITDILNFMTDGDAAGTKWLIHWIAQKVQNPMLLPKVAVVLATRPGSGKGVLAHVIREMLGWENTACIDQSALESRFNGQWHDKLFVLGDEVLSTDKRKDISNTLKKYIDSSTLTVEEKYQHPREVKNACAWMFASNAPVTPLIVEKDDRRYTVFSNHKDVPQLWKTKLNNLFDPMKRELPTEAFFSEISAFMDMCLKLQVDHALVRQPYNNAARQQLIEASMPSYELFFEELAQGNAMKWIKQTERSLDFNDPIAGDWDRKEAGIRLEFLFKVYLTFCRQTQAHSARYASFKAALINSTYNWESHQIGNDWFVKIPR